MSSWKDELFNENKDDLDRIAKESALLHHCPDLFEFLAGSFDEKGAILVPPGSIQIWMEEGRLKTCWKIKAKGVYGFTVLVDEADLSKALQHALTHSQIEWRRDGAKKKS